MNPREAAIVGQDVCRALAAVHLPAIVHRDVKARNIMQRRSRPHRPDGLRRPVSGRARPRIKGTLRDRRHSLYGTGGPRGPARAAAVMCTASACCCITSSRASFPSRGARWTTFARPTWWGGARRSASAPGSPGASTFGRQHALAANPQQRCPSAVALLQALDVVLAEKRTTFRLVLLAVETFVGAAVVVTALGAINSRYFNRVLGRTDFANESVLKWLSVGVSATIAPTVVVLFTLFAVGLLSVAARLLLTMSATARRWRTMLEPAFDAVGSTTSRHCRRGPFSSPPPC